MSRLEKRLRIAGAASSSCAPEILTLLLAYEADHVFTENLQCIEKAS